MIKQKQKIRVLQIEKESLKSEYTLADLRNSGASQKEIDKQQAQVRTFEADSTKARTDYNRRYPSEKIEPKKNMLKFQMMKSQKYLMRDKESKQSLNKMKL